ncbi:uncharacterized protein LOC141632979 [Silene latifolia]|uniref:uncharacterized protein LOC141632979 n=1 Tax=Silene latifolia TaxID=37657 RepID=UPI003D789A7B
MSWVCIGDFNEILLSTEMKGGSRPQWQMNQFRDAVNDCGLRDIAWEGYNFSFDDGQCNEANHQSMLDQALCMESWLELFPFARLYYIAREWSDHAAIKLILNMREHGEGGRRRFRFEQVWVGEEECGEAIARGTARWGGYLVRLIEECSKELRAWKGTNINNINRDIYRKRKQLERLNVGDRSEANVARRRKLFAELAELRCQEERYWRQRSRALWLRD